MATPLDNFELWATTLGAKTDSHEYVREKLRQSFLSFRERVAQLVSTVGAELPNLTVHDITHIDALWRVAYQVAGPNYPLNPAETYVLGGAFLLHDSAHVLAAYPRGLADLKETDQWRDLIAQRYAGVEPSRNSIEEKAALFQVLRHVHAQQAHVLAGVSWAVPGSGDPLYLIENNDLRNYYGDLIGEIAASHHLSPSEVANRFRDRKVPSPAFLGIDAWEVDALKIAFLLRTADAAHIDDQRAPWFLFALRQPEGVSEMHWRFQAKLGQPIRTASGELRISSGAPFTTSERDAWWMAYDVAKVVDRELRNAYDILKEEGRTEFAARAVLGVESPQAFVKQVPVRDWEPIDAAPKVSQLPQLIGRLGGSALYGENLAAPLRELLQNGLDAVRALRALGGLGIDEGEVKVTAERTANGDWDLAVTDTGIGMSRFVLTEVLMDFGTSLWTSDAMRDELSGLAKTGFESVGKFGIGFFSIFMLGNEVKVTTRRFLPSKDCGGVVHWQLTFNAGLSGRPALTKPVAAEQLARSGTRVSVRISQATMVKLLGQSQSKDPLEAVFSSAANTEEVTDAELAERLAWLVTQLCPASQVKITTKLGTHAGFLSAQPNDWTSVDDETVLARSRCRKTPIFPLIDIGGKVIGRIGIPSGQYRSGQASLVFQGVFSGQASGLAGILTASSNNSDARREHAALNGTSSDWTRWAEGLLACGAPLSRYQRLRLHPLVPHLDLEVWQWRGMEVSLADLLQELGDVDAIMLHDGDIEHDESDELSSGTFDNGFSIADNVICVPSFTPRNGWGRFFLDHNELSGKSVFPWSIGSKPINYYSRFFEALEARGLQFNEFDDGPNVVGDVNGVEIIRNAKRLERDL